MEFLQVIGLGFIIVHTISILFIKRLSYVKRVSLAVMMAVLVLSIPFLYSYLPKVVFGVLILATLALYSYLLFFHGSSVLYDDGTDGEFENVTINRPVALQEVEIDNRDSVKKAPVSYSEASQFKQQATDLTQTASYPASLVAGDEQEPLTYGQPVDATGAEITRESESELLNDMLKKLEQIDNLLTQDEAADTEVAKQEEKPPVSEPAASVELAQTSVQTAIEEPAETSDLEQLFNQTATEPNLELEDMMAGKTLSKDLAPEDVPVLTAAEEEELLDEIEHIIASHVETEKEATNQQTVAWTDAKALHANSLDLTGSQVPAENSGKDVFTLKPVDQQTLEKIKEKQEEDGLLSVEEQLDKELYFQFLLYESKELLMMGMYQETVDYLKEILIDSYDKQLRRNALDILESIKVELYHPQLTGDMNQEYKYLEERKVL